MARFAANIQNWVTDFFRLDPDVSKFDLRNICYENGESGREHVYLALGPRTIQAFRYPNATMIKLYPQIPHTGESAKVVLLNSSQREEFSNTFSDDSSLKRILKSLFYDSEGAVKEAQWRGRQKERTTQLKSICAGAVTNSAAAAAYVAEMLKIALPSIRASTVDWELSSTAETKTVNLFSSSLTNTEIQDILTDAITARLIQTTKENVAILVQNQRSSLHPALLEANAAALLLSVDRVLLLTDKL
jgi:hypothetical protein